MANAVQGTTSVGAIPAAGSLTCKLYNCRGIKVWPKKNATGLKNCIEEKNYNLCRLMIKLGQND